MRDATLLQGIRKNFLIVATSKNELYYMIILYKTELRQQKYNTRQGEYSVVLRVNYLVKAKRKLVLLKRK